jgi:hypothetical protein
MFKEVNWDHIESGKYAVLDPLDSGNILYLSPREYVVGSKTWISNDVSVVILATPSDKRPTDDQTDDTDQPKASPRRAKLPGFEAHAKSFKARLWNMFRSPLERFISTTVASKSRKGPSGESEIEIQPAVEINDGNIVDLTLTWGNLLHFRLFGLASGRGLRSSLIEFAEHVKSIHMSQGGLTLTKRLKVYALCVKAYLAGTPYASTESLGVRIRLTHGLPKCLPASVRTAIRSKGVRPIRFWISLLFFYKGMVVKHPGPDISLIVSNPPALEPVTFGDFMRFLPDFVRLFKDVLSTHPKPSFKDVDFLCSFKSGPNGRPAQGRILDDLFAWILDLAHRNGLIPELDSSTPNPPALDALPMIISIRDMMVQARDGCENSLRTLMTSPLFCYAKEAGALHWLLEKILPLFAELERIYATPEQEESTKQLQDELSAFFGLDSEAPLDVDLSDLPGFSPYGVPDIDPALRSTLDPDGKLDPSGSKNMKKADDPKWSYVKSTRWDPNSKKGYNEVLDNDLPRWATLPSSSSNHPRLTKLAFLEEPAGKVRTIALVDWWTQQTLKPIHDWLFRLLASLPTDCTFNQEKGVKTFRPKSDAHVSSFDLKSATELIPQALYSVVLGQFLGQSVAVAWMNLLCDRWFHYDTKDGDKHSSFEPIRYRRGQPMGALSSWASMALVHHALVQFSAWRIGKYPFWDYRILGDDIVIDGLEVSDSYLATCDALQVPVSLSKSLRSTNGFFDFASQIMHGELNYSPISIREELASCTPGKRVEAAMRQVRRGLVDITSNGWFSSYLRYVVNPCVYSQVVDARNGGKLESAAKVVLLTTLGSLESPFGRMGLPGRPELSAIDYFQSLLTGIEVFSRGFNTLFGLKGIWPTAVKDLLAEALVFKAKDVRRKYLQLKPIFDQWRLVSTTGWGAMFIRPMLLGEWQFLAPLLATYNTLQRKVDSMNEWEGRFAVEADAITTIDEVSTQVGMTFGEQMTDEIILSYWDLMTEADDQLALNPEMVLGVVPEKELDHLTNPSPAKINRFLRMTARIQGWSDLVTILSASKSSPILGQPGLSDPGYLKILLETQNQGTTPVIG